MGRKRHSENISVMWHRERVKKYSEVQLDSAMYYFFPFTSTLCAVRGSSWTGESPNWCRAWELCKCSYMSHPWRDVLTVYVGQRTHRTHCSQMELCESHHFFLGATVVCIHLQYSFNFWTLVVSGIAPDEALDWVLFSQHCWHPQYCWAKACNCLQVK